MHICNLDVVITLRCDHGCRNCIEMCGLSDLGVSFDDWDMDIDQIHKFVGQVSSAVKDGVTFGSCHIAGGEPFLHPLINEICDVVDQVSHHFKFIRINTQTGRYSRFAPINYLDLKDKPNEHMCALVAPLDIGLKPNSYNECYHYRKNTLSLSKFGYFFCCAGDGYARLTGQADLFMLDIPRNTDDIKIDKVCKICPWGVSGIPTEKQMGRLITPTYQKYIEDFAKSRTKFIRKF